jgi:hypothetical protein
MKLVTLEDNMSSLSAPATKGVVTSSSPSQTNPKVIGNEVPHFSWLYNDDVLYDALGSINTRTPGSAFGLIMPETKNSSGFGVFRNKYNRPIIVVTETYSGDNDNPMFKQLQETGAWSNNPHVIDVHRGQGAGYMERTIFPNIRDSVMSQLVRLENEGPSNRPILIKIVGRPRTWRYIAEQALQYAELAISLAMDYAAPYVGKVLNVSPAQFLNFKPIIQSLAKNEPVGVQSLAQAASMVVPSSIRPSLDKAASFYQMVQRGNYLSAANELGIDIKGVDRIMNDFAANVPEAAAKTAQGIYIMDTINQVRGSIRSGTAKQDIIQNGTITKTPALQNMILSAMTTTTAAIPRAVEVVGLTAKETDDLQSAAEWRGIYQIAHGVPVTPCSLDRIALRGLVERARELYQRGYKTMNMPAIVPSDKRDCFEDEIRAQTGVTTKSGLGVSPAFLLGVAGVAGVAYFALRK